MTSRVVLSKIDCSHFLELSSGAKERNRLETLEKFANSCFKNSSAMIHLFPYCQFEF